MRGLRGPRQSGHPTYRRAVLGLTRQVHRFGGKAPTPAAAPAARNLLRAPDPSVAVEGLRSGFVAKPEPIRVFFLSIWKGSELTQSPCSDLNGVRVKLGVVWAPLTQKNKNKTKH